MQISLVFAHLVFCADLIPGAASAQGPPLRSAGPDSPSESLAWALGRHAGGCPAGVPCAVLVIGTRGSGVREEAHREREPFSLVTPAAP